LGTNVVHDILDGESASSSVKKRVKEVAQNSLPQPVADFVKKSVGSGSKKQSGGFKRTKKSLKQQKKKNKKTSRKVNDRFSALKLIPE